LIYLKFFSDGQSGVPTAYQLYLRCVPALFTRTELGSRHSVINIIRRLKEALYAFMKQHIQS